MNTLSKLKGARDLAKLNHDSIQSELTQTALEAAEAALQAAEIAEEAADGKEYMTPAEIKQHGEVAKLISKVLSTAPVAPTKPAPINPQPADQPVAPKVEPTGPVTNQLPSDTTGGDEPKATTDINQPATTTESNEPEQTEEKKSQQPAEQ